MQNSHSLLDYYKLILSKVSFDPHLLRKEYYKAIKSLDEADHDDLHRWIDTTDLGIR